IATTISTPIPAVAPCFRIRTSQNAASSGTVALIECSSTRPTAVSRTTMSRSTQSMWRTGRRSSAQTRPATISTYRSPPPHPPLLAPPTPAAVGLGQVVDVLDRVADDRCSARRSEAALLDHRQDDVLG